MDYITSEKNKDLLWNMLYENNIFEGIPNTQWNEVKELFESIILNVSNNSLKNENVLEINKIILGRLTGQIQNFKLCKLKEKIEKNLEPDRDLGYELIKQNKQEDIDFADKRDKPIDNREMDRIIEEKQKERNITLNEKQGDEDVPKLKIEALQRQFVSDIVELGNISVPEIIPQEQNSNIDLVSIHKILNAILVNQEKIIKKLYM
jgi:hypothetical protein